VSKLLAAAGLVGAKQDVDGWNVVMQWLGGGRKSASGETVTPVNSLGLSAYYAAIRNISEDVGKLPFRVYRKTATGKEVAEDNPVNALLYKAPNEEMGPLTFKQVLTAHALGNGNGYAEIVRNAAGTPQALYPLHPDNVKVMRDSITGEIVYQVRQDGSFGGETGKLILIPAADMLHIRGPGGDGLIGYSVCQFAAECLGEALATQKYGGAFFGNGLTLGGLLELPAKLGKEARNRLIESWQKRHQGSDNAHKIGLLEEGVKWVTTSVNPKDAQFMELRKFHVTEIARWFRIPPHKIGDLDRATFSNIEHQGIEYVQDCLMPWLIRWEEEVDAKLLAAEDLFPKFAVQALMRGDSAARAAYYRNQVNIGAMSINEVRSLEDMNAIGEIGDKFFMQVNMTTVDNIVSGESLKPKAGEQVQGAEAEAAPVEELEQEAMEMESRRLAPLVTAAIERVYAKEQKATARAMSKYQGEPEALENWWAAFRAEQRDYFVDALRPIVESIHGAASPKGEKTLQSLEGYLEAHMKIRTPGAAPNCLLLRDCILDILLERDD
jgi:HK97 family phage portal protein